MDKETEIPYTLAYRNVKHPRLEFKTGTLLLVLPKTHKNPKQTLEKYRKWIQRKQQTINKALQEAKTKTINQTRTEKELKSLVNQMVQHFQTELNTHINKIIYRKMKTKWASHSRNNNVTVNRLLKYLPQDLIEYIIYHETTHAIERKHNQNFWNHINKKHPDYETKEKDLLTYWFIIQKTMNNPVQPSEVLNTNLNKLNANRSEQV